MIEFSNGHKLTFACASGALAFDGRGWWWEHPLRWAGVLDPRAFTVVAKTVTMEPRKGNLSMFSPWTCIRLVNDGYHKGMVNAVGLTNPGIKHWIDFDYPVAKKKGYKIAASVKPESLVEAGRMANLLKPLDLAYVEVNISCPNVHNQKDIEDVQAMLVKLAPCNHPIVLKLSYDQCNKEFVSAVDGYVDAYHAINTIPWATLYGDKKSPIEHYNHAQKGGVSGSHIKERACSAVRAVSGSTGKPVIGGGGIFAIEDVMQFEWSGAKAFSIGTCFTLYPWRPNKIVRQYDEVLAERKAGNSRRRNILDPDF